MHFLYGETKGLISNLLWSLLYYSLSSFNGKLNWNSTKSPALMKQSPRPWFVYFSVHFLVICHLEINGKEHVKWKDTFPFMTNPSDEDQERPSAISAFRNGISVNHQCNRWVFSLALKYDFYVSCVGVKRVHWGSACLIWSLIKWLETLWNRLFPTIFCTADLSELYWYCFFPHFRGGGGTFPEDLVQLNSSVKLDIGLGSCTAGCWAVLWTEEECNTLCLGWILKFCLVSQIHREVSVYFSLHESHFILVNITWSEFLKAN